MLRNVFLFLIVVVGLHANERYANFCSTGGKTVVTTGVSGAPKVQASYPQCQVTVFLTGTLTRATLYSDNGTSALANPFTASTNGYFFFYAVNGRYDVMMSGGGLPAPVTLGDVLLADPFAGSTLQLQEPGYTSQGAAADNGWNPMAFWQMNGPASSLTGQIWNNIFNPTTASCSQIVVSSGIATATCNSHGLSNGAGIIIGGFNPEHFGLYGNTTISGVTANSFTYTPYSIPDGTYTDAYVWVLKTAGNDSAKTQVYARTFNPPTAQDGSNMLFESTGSLPAVNAYHNSERRPLGFNDYALTPSGSAMELGDSGPGSIGYFQGGACTYDNGTRTTPTLGWAYDTYGPWTIANTALTSIVYVNTTNIATITLNASGFPNGYLYETVTVGSIIAISGATVDSNLNGDYEVLTRTSKNLFTAQKIPVPGYAKAASATYNESTLVVTPEPHYGGSPCISPWTNSGLFVQIRNALSQGFLVEPMHLPDATRFPFLNQGDSNYAYGVGQKNFNGVMLAKRFGVTLKGTVLGWRGQIPDGNANAMQPLTGVLQAPDATTVTVANTAVGSTLKTLTKIEEFFLTPGRAIRIKAWGLFSSLGGSSDRLSIELISNTDSSAYMIVTSPIGAASNEGWSVEFDLIVLTAGASGTMNLNATGFFSSLGAQSKAPISSPTTVNTTLRQEWQVAALWGAASSSNSVTIQGLTVEILN